MIKLFNVNISPDVDRALIETLHSGYITQGPKVDKFEKVLDEYFYPSSAVTVNSGTSALQLALRLAGVGPGDEVITTAMTCSATNLPILALGAKPIWADINKLTGNIDPESVENLINEKTKAVMCVAWGGLPCDTEILQKITEKHGIKLIEDAAHAMGLRDSFADYVCFSLQAIKHITTGDGGIVLVNTDDAAVARAKRLRWFGIDRKAGSKDTRIEEDIEEWGYKFHMNDLTATMGLVQIKTLNKILARHREIAKKYRQALSNYFVGPAQSNLAGAENHYWLYTVLLPSSGQRNSFKDWMLKHNVQVSQVHRRNDEYTVFNTSKNQYLPDIGITRGLESLDYFAERMICLPIHNGMSNEDVSQVISVANKFALEHQR